MMKYFIILLCTIGWALPANAIIIVDLPPTPYEPPADCYEGYELSDTNECVRVEIQSCVLQQVLRCDNRCKMKHVKFHHKWWKHKYRKWDLCNRRLPRTIYGIKEVIIRDDGEVVAESECERQ